MSDDKVLEEMQDGLDNADALTLKDLKAATISRAIPTAIADSGASTTCVQPKEEQMQASECGKYTWDDPLSATNTKSDKVFQMARGDVAPGEDVVHLNALPLRRGAAEAHTVRGLTNSLISMSTLRKHGYIPIFEQDKMSVYDGPTTTITVSRKAVMEGWYCPKEKLWRIPLVKNVSNVQHQSIPVAMSPMQILQDGPPPPTDQILSAYELTTRPELIRYYHAAAGFPSKPTWVAAIKKRPLSILDRTHRSSRGEIFPRIHGNMERPWSKNKNEPSLYENSNRRQGLLLPRRPPGTQACKRAREGIHKDPIPRKTVCTVKGARARGSYGFQ